MAFENITQSLGQYPQLYLQAAIAAQEQANRRRNLGLQKQKDLISGILQAVGMYGDIKDKAADKSFRAKQAEATAARQEREDLLTAQHRADTLALQRAELAERKRAAEAQEGLGGRRIDVQEEQFGREFELKQWHAFNEGRRLDEELLTNKVNRERAGVEIKALKAKMERDGFADDRMKAFYEALDKVETLEDQLTVLRIYDPNLAETMRHNIATEDIASLNARAAWRRAIGEGDPDKRQESMQKFIASRRDSAESSYASALDDIEAKKVEKALSVKEVSALKEEALSQRDKELSFLNEVEGSGLLVKVPDYNIYGKLRQAWMGGEIDLATALEKLSEEADQKKESAKKPKVADATENAVSALLGSLGLPQ